MSNVEVKQTSVFIIPCSLFDIHSNPNSTAKTNDYRLSTSSFSKNKKASSFDEAIF